MPISAGPSSAAVSLQGALARLDELESLLGSLREDIRSALSVTEETRLFDAEQFDSVLQGCLRSLTEKPSALYQRACEAGKEPSQAVDVRLKGWHQRVEEGLRRLDGRSWSRESPVGKVLEKKRDGYLVRFNALEVRDYIWAQFIHMQRAVVQDEALEDGDGFPVPNDCLIQPSCEGAATTSQ